jgi:hypothetical protein
MNQLFLYCTASAKLILADFIREVFWARSAGGGQQVSLEDSYYFVEQAVRDGKTQKPWSETTVKRISSYLVGCCAITACCRPVARPNAAFNFCVSNRLLCSFWYTNCTLTVLATMPSLTTQPGAWSGAC